jgi:hypothetical protein
MINLDKESIKQAMLDSYADFKKQNPDNPSDLIGEMISYINTEQTEISYIMSIINKYNINLAKYRDTIKSSYDNNEKMRLWVIRNFIFYQLLIVVVNNISKTNDLSNFYLNIFGSVTPESDIDIGICMHHVNCTINMSKIIKIFEQSFTQLTCKSLDLDIEMYADFNNLVNKNKLMAVNDLNKLMPCIGAGIIRNAIMGEEEYSKKSVTNDYILSYTFDDIFNNEYVNQVFPQYKVKPENWRITSKTCILEYHMLSHIERNEKYYELVDIAQTNICNPNTDIYILLNSLAMCNVYREESLISIFSILHTVQMLQDEKIPGELQKLNECDNPEFKSVKCYVNKTGYIISLLEQVGYINRWNKVYCGCTDVDKCSSYILKCKKKFDKYNSRAADAFTKITSLYKYYNPIEKTHLMISGGAFNKCLAIGLLLILIILSVLIINNYFMSNKQCDVII